MKGRKNEMKKKLKNFWNQFVYILGIIKDGAEQVFNFLTVLFVIAMYIATGFTIAMIAINHGHEVGLVWFSGISLSIMALLFTWVAWPMLHDFYQHISDMVMEIKSRKQNN